MVILTKMLAQMSLDNNHMMTESPLLQETGGISSFCCSEGRFPFTHGPFGQHRGKYCFAETEVPAAMGRGHFSGHMAPGPFPGHMGHGPFPGHKGHGPFMGHMGHGPFMGHMGPGPHTDQVGPGPFAGHMGPTRYGGCHKSHPGFHPHGDFGQRRGCPFQDRDCFRRQPDFPCDHIPRDLPTWGFPQGFFMFKFSGCPKHFEGKERFNPEAFFRGLPAPEGDTNEQPSADKPDGFKGRWSSRPSFGPQHFREHCGPWGRMKPDTKDQGKPREEGPKDCVTPHQSEASTPDQP